MPDSRDRVVDGGRQAGVPPGTPLMSVVVSGATMQAMPIPNSSTAGSTSMNTPGGGISVARSVSDACHGCESTGTRASHSSPLATIERPDHEEGPRAEPSRRRPQRGRQQCQAKPRREADGARAEGRVAQDVLEQDPLVAERDVEATVDEERGEVDRGEHPVPEE